MKTLCVRFDIDTPTCLREGVPRLLDMTDRLGVRSTYFLSVGRAISRAGAFARVVAPKHGVARAAGFSAMRKLGKARYGMLALLNPEIGRAAPDIVRRLNASAEVGLHGGRNHDLWQHHAHEWSREQVEAEIDWALPWLREQGVAVHGFSSPGWTEPADFAAILEARGFRYRADMYGFALKEGVEERPGFFNLATNLVGEPGGVAYLEHKRALGLTDAEIRRQFLAELAAVGDHAVLYDHPYYAGLQAVDLLKSLIVAAIDQGYALVTMSDIATRLSQNIVGRAATVDAL